MAKNTTRYLLLTILIVAVFILALLFLNNQRSPSDVATSTLPPANQEGQSPAPTPQPSENFDYLPNSTSSKVITHSHFSLSYREEHEQAEWVAYELTAEEVNGDEGRTDDFREDPEVTTGSATLKDYYRSGYDRGHLAPAGDMKFSEEAMSESFYMSNMTPQKPSFNRGIWRKLEKEVREQAVQNGSLFVVTGPVFGGQNQKIGESGVTIPQAYYKVLLDYTEPEIKAIAFILANEGSKKDVYDFAVTIDSVEQVTNIDFFPALPNLEEDMLERQANPSQWIGGL